MSAPLRHWPSLVPVLRGPLIRQPFAILAYVLTALVWTLVASALCVGRLAAVVAGESAFIGGIAFARLTRTPA